MKFDTILKSPYKDELSSYAPGVDATLRDETIAPHIRSSEKVLINAIGQKTYKQIKDLKEPDTLRNEFVAALSNLVMYNYKMWEVVSKRQDQQKDTYKYEMEIMRGHYVDYYFSHFDDVIRQLDERSTEFKDWNTSTQKQMVKDLLLQNADDFNAAYNIDDSYFFFFITIFLQRKVLDKHINPAICKEDLTDDQLRRIKVITAQLTVAYALRQLDFVCLPKSIRASTVEGPSRTGKDEQTAVIALSDFLFNEAISDLSALLTAINAPADGGDIDSPSDENKPWNKYFLMS